MAVLLDNRIQAQKFQALVAFNTLYIFRIRIFKKSIIIPAKCPDVPLLLFTVCLDYFGCLLVDRILSLVFIWYS